MSRSSGTTDLPPVSVEEVAPPIRQHAGWAFAALALLNVLDLVETFLLRCG